MLRSRAAAEHGLAAVLALLMLAPVLRPGYVLSYDMVATPRVPFTAAMLGWGDGLPRAVPQDAVLAVLTTVVPGWLVQVVALVAVVWLAVVGAARLVPSERLVVRLVAGAAYGWNAFVAERLLIGHWGLLLGYAALPWIVRAAQAARRGAHPLPVVAWSALAMLTPTGGLIAALTAAAVLTWPARPAEPGRPSRPREPAERPRSAESAEPFRARGPAAQARPGEPAAGPGARVRRGRAWEGRARPGWALAVFALNAPWIVAGAVARVSAVSDPDGVAAFAARAENWSGALGAVLGLGGIWNAEVVPVSRTLVVAPLFTLLVLIVAALGLPRAVGLPRAAGVPRAVGVRRAALGDRNASVPPASVSPASVPPASVAPALVAVAAGSVVVALFGVLPGGDRALGVVVEFVPGTGLLRDGQKFLAPFALLLALSFALGVERIADALRRRGARPAAAAIGVAALLFPVVALPDLAWGGAGRLASVRYPADWDRVADVLAADEAGGGAETAGGGEAAVLPFSTFRAFDWNGGRTALDPAPRFFPVDVIVEDALPIGGRTVTGESARATAVRDALADGRSLTSVGVRWVIVERGTPGPVPGTALVGYRAVWTGPDLVLYRADAIRTPPADSETVRVVSVVAGYAVSVGVLLGALASWALTRSRRHSIIFR